MPRYRYKCDNCGVEAMVYHLIHETVDECLACRQRQTMVKQLTTPQYKTKIEQQPQKIGAITEEFIDLKTREYEGYAGQVTPWEIEQYLTFF